MCIVFHYAIDVVVQLLGICCCLYYKSDPVFTYSGSHGCDLLMIMRMMLTASPLDPFSHAY